MGRKERRAEVVALFPIGRNANRMTQRAVPGRHAGGRGRRHWLGVIKSATAAAEGGECGGDDNSNAHSGRERERERERERRVGATRSVDEQQCRGCNCRSRCGAWQRRQMDRDGGDWPVCKPHQK